MPRLLAGAGSTDLVNRQVGTFGFSAIRPEKLTASEYTLVQIARDKSSSISGFEPEINKCLQEAVRSCSMNPRAENLLLRVVNFGSNIQEEHGFVPLSMLKVDDYQPANAGGSTVLYDTLYSTIGAAQVYGSDLVKKGFSVNAVTMIITDGEDVGSKMGTKEVKTLIEDLKKKEQIESHQTILIGINAASLVNTHKKVVQDCGLTQYVDAGDANPKNLAKLANFISRSISSVSQSLGKGPSQPLTI